MTIHGDRLQARTWLEEAVYDAVDDDDPTARVAALDEIPRLVFQLRYLESRCAELDAAAEARRDRAAFLDALGLAEVARSGPRSAVTVPA